MPGHCAQDDAQHDPLEIGVSAGCVSTPIRAQPYDPVVSLRGAA